MRHLLALVLLAFGAYQAWRDWGATIGEGKAYALASVDAVWQGIWPTGREWLLPLVENGRFPYLWDPILVTVLTLPFAAVCFGLAIFFFLIRRREEA